MRGVLQMTETNAKEVPVYDIIRQLDASRGEKLLMYLYHYGKKFDLEFVLPKELTQEGIFENIGIYQGNIHEVVNDLNAKERNFVLTKISHVKEKKKRLKVYGLSEKGKKYAKDLLAGYGLSGLSSLREKDILLDEGKRKEIAEKAKITADQISGFAKIPFVSFEKIDTIHHCPLFLAVGEEIFGRMLKQIICVFPAIILPKTKKDSKRVFGTILRQISKKQKEFKAPLSTMLSKTPLEHELAEMARRSNVDILTLAEIEERLLRWSKLREKIIKDFEESDLAKAFVDAKCCEKEKDIQNQKKRTLITKRFSEFLTGNNSCLLVFGDFGTGKTSSVLHLIYSIAKETKDYELPNYYPIYVRLKDFLRAPNPIGFICRDINRRLGISIDEKLFKTFLYKRPFLIVLDGFDEMDIVVDRTQLMRNLTTLKSLSHYPKVKYIITSRTHLFRYDLTIVEDGTTETLFLCPWNKTEWKDFSKKLFGENWQAFFSRLISSENSLFQKAVFREVLRALNSLPFCKIE